MKKIYKFDKEQGLARCVLINKDNEAFLGMAECAPADEDMKSEYTGLHIAENRAFYKFIKNEIKRDKLILTDLKHLYDCMSQNKNFNSKSYEAKMLRRRIKFYETEIAIYKEELNNIEYGLKNYITEKDKLYKQIRNNRKKMSK